MRATKIVATLGPASSSPEMLERLIRAGVDVVRLNFSHGKAQDHIDRAALVREVAARAAKEVAIMADLQGPKIRVGKFDGGKTELRPGQPFVLDAARTEPGNNDIVGLDYKDLPRDVRPGDTLRAEITVEGKKNLSDGKRGIMQGRVRVFNQRAQQVFEFSEKLMMRRGRVDDLV